MVSVDDDDPISVITQLRSASNQPPQYQKGYYESTARSFVFILNDKADSK